MISFRNAYGVKLRRLDRVYWSLNRHPKAWGTIGHNWAYSAKGYWRMSWSFTNFWYHLETSSVSPFIKWQEIFFHKRTAGFPWGVGALAAEWWSTGIFHFPRCALRWLSVGVLASNAGVPVPTSFPSAIAPGRVDVLGRYFCLMAQFWFGFCFSLKVFGNSGDHFSKRVKSGGKGEGVDRPPV